MKTKLIAIIGATAAVVSAAELVLTKKFPKAEFKSFTKFSEIPANGDVSIVTVGLPNYLPTKRNHEIIVINARYDADEAKQRELWDKLRDEKATPEEIVQILAEPNYYSVYPHESVMESRLAFMQAKMDMADAKTDEEKLALLTTMNEILSAASPITT